ncbi:MAG: TrmH family RNA methyltransferase [Bacteroidota bacterium]
MLSKADIKRIRSLHQRKFRELEGMFIAEGPKLVDELLRSHSGAVWIYHTTEWHPPAVRRSDVHLVEVSEKELEQISAFDTANRVLAVSAIPTRSSFVEAPANGLHLLLDRISDPGNLGTIIRIADWFGIDTVFCSLDTVELYNPKVLQATMGSAFRVKLRYVSLPELLMKNSLGASLPVFAAVLGGENLYSHSLAQDALLILGNESHGLSPLLLPFVTASLSIPAYQSSSGNGHAESLNVAVATGILCAEFRRKSGK